MGVLYLTDLVPTDKFGSMEEQIFEIAKGFKVRNQVFVPVLCDIPGAALKARYRDAGLHISGADLHRFRIGSLARLLRLIRRHRIRTVHWNFYSPINPYVWALSLFAPSVRHHRTDHTSRSLPLPPAPRGVKRAVMAMLFRRYSRVFCISEYVAKCLEYQGTASNLVQLPHFINTNRFRPRLEARAEMRSSTGDAEAYVILLVANVIPEKGGDILLRALAKLPEHTVVWIVGDGTDLPRLKTIAIELGVAHRVRFFGNQRNVEPYMQASDCLACPSTWGEACGFVNLEAMASGLPVVASRIGGIPEFVIDKCTGLLFEPHDSDDMASQLARLVKDSELSTRLGSEGRRVALERYSIQRRMDDYANAYAG